MRFVISIVAALMIMGLAAFGTSQYKKCLRRARRPLRPIRPQRRHRKPRPLPRGVIQSIPSARLLKPALKPLRRRLRPLAPECRN